MLVSHLCDTTACTISPAQMYSLVRMTIFSKSARLILGVNVIGLRRCFVRTLRKGRFRREIIRSMRAVASV